MSDEAHEAGEETSIIDQMGGVRGLVLSTLPVLAFVPINSFWGLKPAIVGAVAASVLLLLWSLIRRERLQPAFSSFFAVALCAFIAWRTGDAKGYFLYGIITQLVYALVFAVSALLRWPLVGVIWGFLAGHGQQWRREVYIRRWYTIATSVWAAIFGLRFALQALLYRNDDVTWLGVARIAMGWPLSLVGFAITVLAIERVGHKRATRTKIIGASTEDVR